MRELLHSFPHAIGNVPSAAGGGAPGGGGRDGAKPKHKRDSSVGVQGAAAGSLSPFDRDLLWALRQELRSCAEALPAVLLAADWTSPEVRRTAMTGSLVLGGGLRRCANEPAAMNAT